MQVLERAPARDRSDDTGQARVLFVTDGSSAAQAAMYEAIHLAASHRAELIALYVLDTRHGRRLSHLLRAALEGERQEASRDIREVLDAARRRGVAARGALIRGRPGEAVCRAVQRYGAEMVVMRAGALDSGRGLTDGSTSEYLLRHSASPVCLVGSVWQPRLGAPL